MTANNEFQELEDLRKGYNLVSDKYASSDDKDREFHIKDVRNKLNGTQRWYMFRMATMVLGIIAVPVIFLRFRRLGIYQPEYTYYLVFFLILSVCSLAADLYARSVLAPKQLPYLSLREAAEHVIRHKKVRNRLTLANIPLFAIFIIWTFHIATGGTWDFSHMIYSLVFMAVCFVIGLQRIRKNRKDLESICKGLED